jgi:hypothetical protein
VSDSPEVEHTEALLWEAILSFATSDRNTAQNAATAVRALAAYRAALEAQAVAREGRRDHQSDYPRHHAG